MRSYAFQEEFYRFGHGIVADLLTTRYSKLKGIIVALPDEETQKQIADFLDRETSRIDLLIEKKEAFSSSIEERLSSLGASKSVKLEVGKLFLSIAGSVGKPCLTRIKACIHDGFVYFPHLPKETQKYLYYVFSAGKCFLGLGKLGTQLNLNTATVGDIKIPFPSVDEQEKIARKLDAIVDEQLKITDKNKTSIELLHQFRVGASASHAELYRGELAGHGGIRHAFG